MKFKYKGYLLQQLEGYLRSKSINTRKNFKCLNSSAHKNGDKLPSMGYKFNIVKCFSCGFKGDIFNIVGFEYGLDTFKKQYEKLCLLFGLDDEFIQGKNKSVVTHKIKSVESIKNIEVEINLDLTYSILKAHRVSPGYDYFCNVRGLSKNVVDRYKLCVYDPRDIVDIKYLPATTDIRNFNIIFPIWDNRKVVSVVLRRNDKLTNNKIKILNLKDIGIKMFNKNIIKNNDVNVIYICESITDSLSLESIGLHSIALNSTSNCDKFIEFIKNQKPLIKEKQFIICGDNDKSGCKMNQLLSNGLNNLCVDNKILEISKVNDINEMLLSNELHNII